MSISRKRGRDEMDDDILELEHAAKTIKPCSLPFRTSPTSKHIRSFSHSSRSRPAPLFTQTITPADSEEENSPLASVKNTQRESIIVSNQSVDEQKDSIITQNYIEQPQDTEISMTDAQSPRIPHFSIQQALEPTPDPSPRTVTPPSLPSEQPKDTDTSVLTGRMPTPIYGHFQQNIDSRMDTCDSPNIYPPLPTTQQSLDYENHLRLRRLPTPIDEDSPMDNFNNLTPITAPPRQNRRLAISSSSHFMQPAPVKSNVSVGAFMAPPRAGGARLSFSMGVRADCEMCRARVPGHSNHLFRC